MIPDISIEGLSISALELVLTPKIIQLATTSTTNKVGSTATSSVKKLLSGKYNITQKNLTARGKSNRNGMRLQKAKTGSSAAYILSFGRPLPVVRFKVSPKTPEAFRARKRGKGITYQVRKGKKVAVRSGFIARMPSGHVGAFLRKGRERAPIKELFGPSIPQMLGETDSINEVRGTVSRRWPIVYQHELQFRLGKVFK